VLPAAAVLPAAGVPARAVAGAPDPAVAAPEQPLARTASAAAVAISRRRM
jgi:hypothetical protein